MKPISARRDEPESGASLLDALVGVVLVATALLVAAAILAPALHALSAHEARARASDRATVEAFE